MLPKINSSHGSETRNIINAAIDSINAQGKSIQDLVAEGQLTPTEYAMLIQTVNGLISKGNVSPLDINKNLGKFDSTYFSSDFLTELNKGKVVATELLPESVTTDNLASSAVTYDKTNFIELGKNLFNKANVKPSTSLNTTNGAEVPSTWHSLFKGDLTGVESIAQSHQFAITFYSDSDALLGFFDQATPYKTARTVSVPAGTAYYKTASLTSDLDVYQIEVGGLATAYERWGLRVEGIQVERDDLKNGTVTGDKVADSVIEGELLSFHNQCRFDYSNNLLTINARLLHKGRTIVLPNKTLDFTDLTSNNYYILFYNVQTEALVAQSQNTFLGDDDTIVIGAFNPVGKQVIGIERYQVDGEEYGHSYASYPSLFQGFFMGDSKAIDFDWENNQIVLGQAVGRIFSRGNAYTISSQTIDINTLTGQEFIIAYDVDDNQIKTIRSNLGIPKNYIPFGGFDKSTRKVYDISNYQENGGRYDDNLTFAEKDYYSIEELPQGMYTGDIIPGAGTSDDFVLNDTTHEDVYSWYDNLSNEFDGYIQKFEAATETTGKPVYGYHFKLPGFKIVQSSADFESKTPKVMLISGTHGNEKAGVYALYNTMNRICREWKENEHLDYLRWNAEYIVVPVLNPAGYDLHTRKNANGVDLNRNMEDGWNLIAPETAVAYGGPSPLSEPETQGLDALIKEHRENLVYVCDFHNFYSAGSGNEEIFLWNNGSAKFNNNVGKTHLRQMSRKWKKEYPFLPQSDEVMFGYVSFPPGGTIAHDVGKYGIQSSVYEIGERFFAQPNSSVHNELALTLGTEGFINWLAIILDQVTKRLN